MQFPASQFVDHAIRARTDIAVHRHRTPIGIKVFGSSWRRWRRGARDRDRWCATCPHSSAYAERLTAACTSTSCRPRAARPATASPVGELMDTIAMALGGEVLKHHRRGPQPLRRDRALPARCAFRPAAHRARGAGAGDGRDGQPPAMIRSARWRGVQRAHRRAGDPHRERPAVGPTLVDIRDRDIGGYVASAQQACATTSSSARHVRHLSASSSTSSGRSTS